MQILSAILLCNKLANLRIKFLVYENGMPIHDLDAAADITRISLIEDGKEIEQKNIITKLVNNGMSIEDLSQKLNMSIADINNILNQDATAKEKN